VPVIKLLQLRDRLASTLVPVIFGQSSVETMKAERLISCAVLDPDKAEMLVRAFQWYALALWFGLGVFVCFADAAIAASSSGGTAQVAFHMSSGVLCAGLAVLLGRIAGLTTIRG
jgi:hypothetical protein